MTSPDKDPLDAFFEAAQADPPKVNDALMARIMVNAQQLQPVVPVLDGPKPETFGLWTRIKDGMGGWPSMAGLATAAVAGLWIGIDTPTLADGVMSLYFDTGLDSDFVEDDVAWATVFEEL